MIDFHAMDTTKLLGEVKKEIKRLQKIASLLGGDSTKGKGMTQAARKKIAAAQKKRWAKVRAEKAKG
jgi:hypothetical protein